MPAAIPRLLQIALVAGAIICLWLGQVQAKRGCIAFGHSCFGGHGKRSDQEVFSPYETPETTALVNQRSPTGYNTQLQPSDVDDEAIRSNLEHIIVKWLQRYRLMQLGEPMKPSDGTVD
ncbi:neuropeptide CCHamide-2-like [Ctenocephalides felis]|uniref:neuropeptide CCHamide-2-like n=1 Tax=Ctenocephalides felis TaxID=7515 RepID=UPI000E6E46EB|nr:neuropeptide CCHamide-2-like [Ctenocephalides felis]XP_026475114.1 neuropeptide CCHamide-2-like [Ctenocephalides felis]